MGDVVVVAGGTGLVGSALVQQLCEDPEVERVVCVGRRAHPLQHPKLESRVVPVLKELKDDEIPKDATVAYCALGTTMKQAGSKEAFLDVDERAVLAFARACRKGGVRRFVLVSSIGADRRSMNFYLRVKGEVEEAVRALGFDGAHILRPSFLDGERREARTGEKLGMVVANAAMSVLGTSWRYAPIKDHVVARAMRRMARDVAPGFFVHESKELQSLGKA
jgi:uncharacterized protein YbjT (DUF2867 family)